MVIVLAKGLVRINYISAILDVFVKKSWDPKCHGIHEVDIVLQCQHEDCQLYLAVYLRPAQIQSHLIYFNISIAVHLFKGTAAFTEINRIFV